jgi:GxxExxY protein
MDELQKVAAKRIELDRIGKIIFESALSVHKEMGPGLLEAVYHHCIIRELTMRGLQVESNVFTALHYKGQPLGKDYVIDLLVENEVIIEVKAIENLLQVHEAQIISYLKIANKRLGYLINFNVPLLKSGCKRFVNNF